ncbi:MAG: elongation factor G [Candidatus Omnitrophica bacterium]|nr:elongation factor G [Candidatus Omnitrophota bacterium]
MAFATKDIRNVVLLSHAGEGKTTLVEDLLFKGGAISRKGSVSAGTTVSDYNDDEKDRKNSINLSVSFYEKDGVKVNLLDAPGFLDYSGDVAAGVAAADAVVLLVDAGGGVKVGTNKFWKLAKKRGLPAIIVVNRMDKDNADFAGVLASIQKAIGRNAVAICYPVGSGSNFTGVVNLLTQDGMDKLEGDDKTKAEGLSAALTESVAESDDALLEKYIEEGALSPDEINSAFRAGCVSGKIMPVIPASAEKGIGIDEIMTAINKYLPSPVDAKAAETASGEGSSDTSFIEPKADLPFSAQVFKTISDPFAGQISIFRIMSGSAKGNQAVKNSTKGEIEKFGHLFFVRGKEQIETDAAVAGDIAAIAKLKNTETNDTLCAEKNPVQFKKIYFPEAAVSFSIKPKSRSDEDKISAALVKLTAEDPVFTTLRDKQTHELVISGMGELHLKTMVNRLRNRYGVDVEIGTPKVAYKETISVSGEGHYRHKKQSGGAGQFAEVWLRVTPLGSEEGFEFVDDIVGGVIPKPLIGSCEKGIRKALDEGIQAGFQVVDVRVSVYDGKTHPVDSKDVAFQVAAAHAFREACINSKPVLLEPIMNVELAVPEESMGDVTSSLSTRRGRVQGMDSDGSMQIVNAEIPLEEMYKYANELKSITAGRSTYAMSFARYEAVPANVAQKIIAENKKETNSE